MMSKQSIFVSAISSSTFGGSDWTLAESTLSVFGCVYVCWCGVGRCGGGGCDGCGGVDEGDDGGGGDGGGGGGGDAGDDFGWEVFFDCLFKGLPLEVGRLPHFRTMRVGTFWSRNAPVLLY